MKEIIVWGMDGGGNFSVLLPVTAQLQGSWNWSGDTKIFHLIGGGVAAYSAGIKTRGSGSLLLELKGRSALEQLMECVKYGALLVGGGQFGGVRYENEVQITGAESIYAGRVCYISGDVSTSVIQESSEWFSVKIPVEIGESAAAFPCFYVVADAFSGDSAPAESQSISLYKNGTEHPVALNTGTVTSIKFTKPGRFLIRETTRWLSPVSANAYGYRNAQGVFEVAAHFNLQQSAAADELGGAVTLDHVYTNGEETAYSLTDERWPLPCPLAYNEHIFVVSMMVGGCVMRDTYVLSILNPEAAT